MRLLNETEMSVVVGGSINGQNDPYSWDGKGNDGDSDGDGGGGDGDRCSGIENESARDVCRLAPVAVELCGKGNVAYIKVVKTDDDTDRSVNVGVSLGDRGEEIGGKYDVTEGGSTAEIGCKQ